MSSTDLHHLPQRNQDVELREIGAQSVLVAPSGDTFALNPTARAIWELCDGTTTVDELAVAISEVFAIDRATAIDDVTATIEQLRTVGLVISDSS